MIKLFFIGGYCVEKEFIQTMDYVISVLKSAGYDPYERLRAYLQTGNASFITRKGNARELITRIDRALLEQYVSHKLNKTTQQKQPR